MSAERVAVVGAGVAGLGTAIALERRGWQVTLIERCKSIPQKGGLVLLWPNGVTALRKLGLHAEVSRWGTEIHRLSMRAWDDALLALLPTTLLGTTREGTPLLLQRGELTQALAATRTSMRRLFGQACTSIQQTGRSCTLLGHDGQRLPETEDYELVVVADGIHSRLASMLQPRLPRPKPHSDELWIGTSPVPTPGLEFGELFMSMGASTRCLYGALPAVPHLRDQGVVHWGLYGRNLGAAGDSLQALVHALASKVGAINSPTRTLLERSTSIKRVQVWQRPPLRKWVHGRVVVLGDAAHPTMPHLGQGAAQALVSAACLAEMLEPRAAQSRSLRRFEQRSKPLANALSHMAPWLADIWWPMGSLAEMRAAIQKSRTSHAFSRPTAAKLPDRG